MISQSNLLEIGAHHVCDCRRLKGLRERFKGTRSLILYLPHRQCR